MKTAMSRFPIWVANATAFYAPLRALQNGVQYIYDLDTAMTNLQKSQKTQRLNIVNSFKTRAA